jgi:threonylcarbamoyladenosine tRNA methylthiotransferase MtaB
MSERALPTLAFQTFGCRLNQAESEGWQSALAAAGYAIVDAAQADVFIVHSCAVTEPAVKEVTKLLKAAKKRTPAQRLILSGCAAELVKGVAIDLRIPHAQKPAWVQHVTTFLNTLPCATPPAAPPPRPHRTRASLILQDGCDHFCAYCIVPHLRGKPISEPAEVILQRAQVLFAQGYEEIVLTGCHLALYREPTAGFDFIELLKRLQDVPGEGRFRIGSLEPCVLDDKALVRLIAQSQGRICSFLHLPMQSADDEVLRRMGRRYSQADLRNLLELIASELPGCGLGADWIAGLPGESEAAFQTTADFISAYPFTGAHVFPYSKRDGTPAATFPDQIPEAEILRRAKVLRERAAVQQQCQLQQVIGKPLEVIPEQQRGDYRFGWSAERFHCRLPAHVARGKRIHVTPTALEGDLLIVNEA